jgi:hypothetical protein
MDKQHRVSLPLLCIISSCEMPAASDGVVAIASAADAAYVTAV